MTDKNRFVEWEYPEIEEGIPTKYQWLVRHKEGFSLGVKTDIGAFTYVNARNGVTIEDYVQIGSHCSIYSVSTIDGKEGSVLLERNCRIGSHSTIMPGVSVGRNSIIGAHSFVNKNIPENTIAFGNPVRIVRKLSDEEIIQTEEAIL